jgi:multiple sugar transport system substrate-binding protein/sn-glycerol 3-phosphate transport system substrate-binding protein
MSLSACGSKEGVDKEIYGDLEKLDPSGVTITYWYQHHSSREEILQEMIADFNAANDWGITVVGEQQGDYADIYEKVRTAIIGGGLPDISVAYPNQAATYATLDAVVDLTPYIESKKWGFSDDEMNDFFNNALDADKLPQFEGKRFGFPPYRSMEVLYYNEDWLKELGYDGPPETWEEFREMACAAASGEDRYGYEFSVDASTFMDMLMTRGGKPLKDDASAYDFGGDAGKETLEFLQGLFDDGCAILETEDYGDQSDFGAGKVLFTISSTSGLPYYRSVVAEGANFDWSIALLPRDRDDPVIDVYGASLSVFKSDPDRQLASWLFLKWLAEAQQQARWSRGTNYFPTRQSVANEMTQYFSENPQYEKAFHFLENAWAIEPGVAAYDECRAEINAMLNAVVAGEDVDQWLSDTLGECNKILEWLAPE